MKILNYKDAESKRFDAGDQVKGVTARVVIGKNDGAGNFCMRVFEIEPGGYTPRHSHDWEHEIFIHAGEGAVLLNNDWKAVKTGTALFIPGNEEHQMKNTGDSSLTFVCLIPAGAPEL